VIDAYLKAAETAAVQGASLKEVAWGAFKAPSPVFIAGWPPLASGIWVLLTCCT
jgi:hypothetical protein